MSTLRTNSIQTLDSVVTVDVEDLVVEQDLFQLSKAVPTVADLRNVSKLVNSYVNTLGYYLAGDGGEASYRYDSTDLVSVDDGGSVIVGVDGGRWKLIHSGRVRVKQFGLKGDGVTDDTARLQAVRDWVATQPDLPQLIFTPGIYLYSVSPNWAIQDVEVICEGEVKLRYTGVGNAVIFDANALDAVGPLVGVIYNVQFGGSNRFIVECPGTALNAFFVRSVHHSKIRGVVRGAGTASAGLKVNFAVLTEFDIVVSGNEVGVWYLGAKPAVGYSLDQRGVGETASYCYFPNPIVEGPDIGIHLVNSLGNIFMGGASEGCSTYGVLAEAGALSDKFIGTDFEVNAVADVFCQGFGVEFINCDSFTLIQFGSSSKRCLLTGGQHNSIGLDSGSLACRVLHTTFNRFSGAGTFLDLSTSSTVLDVRNASGAPALSGSATFDPPSMIAGAVATTTIAVSGARLGDGVNISSGTHLSGLMLTAAVTAADTVTVYLTNVAGIVVDAPSTTLRAWVIRESF